MIVQQMSGGAFFVYISTETANEMRLNKGGELRETLKGRTLCLRKVRRVSNATKEVL